MMTECSINISAQVQSLGVVLAFIEETLKPTFCPLKVKQQIELSVEELFVNIATYAYEDTIGMADISASIASDANVTMLRVVFKDRGKQFNPLTHDDPDTTIPLDEREPGGLGIFLTKNSVDDIIYEYVDGCNKTTIVKIWAEDKDDKRKT